MFTDGSADDYSEQEDVRKKCSLREWSHNKIKIGTNEALQSLKEVMEDFEGFMLFLIAKKNRIPRFGETIRYGRL